VAVRAADLEGKVRFQLLGPVQGWTGDRPVGLGARKQRFVFALLALEANRLVPMSRLVDLVWPDNPPVSARAMVHTCVSGLRSILHQQGAAAQGVALISEPAGYALRCDSTRVDAHRFRRLVADARAEPDDERRVALFDEALAMWRGPALTGVTAEATRARLCRHLDEARLAAIEDRAEAQLHLGRHRELVDELAAIAENHPHRQRLIYSLMLALHRCGRPDEALRFYGRTRQELADEFGLDPSDELQRLYKGILRDDPGLARAVGVQRPQEATAKEVTAPVRPMQLPGDLACFTGRTAQIRQLDLLLSHGADRPTAVVISAIDGTAGVGKTALAIHWAHRVADRFPDGQFYINLRGFDPRGTPVEPTTAVRAFLDALGVAPQRIPVDLDLQAALYRSLLSGKRVLVLLDNARDSDQVRPLLPGAPGCLALVTSRRRLTGLFTVEGAQLVTLDVLSTGEAHQMLASRLGTDRVAAEPDAAAKIVTACARLPLALAVAAARAATHAHLRLGALAAQLGEARVRLDVLGADDPATDVRAVFSWSYQALGPAAGRLFRLLGLHPGPDVGVGAIASLAGASVPRVRVQLDELMRASLLVERAPGRYTFHDLLRAYALELAHAVDSEALVHDSRHRMLDYYLHSAYAADSRLALKRERTIKPTPARDGVVCEAFDDTDAAMSWFAEELPVLLAAVQLAATTGFDIHTGQFAWYLTPFLRRRGHWLDWAAIQRAAVKSARRLGDPAAQAHAHRGLGSAFVRLARYDDADVELQRALEFYREAGDLLGQARTHHIRGTMFDHLGQQHRLIDESRCAHALYRAAGDRAGEATTLSDLGWSYSLLGDHRQAVITCRQALTLLQEIGIRSGEAAVWDSLGYAHHHLGQYREAVECYQNALAFEREIGDLYSQSVVLGHLGDTHHAMGDEDAAQREWRAALVILEELGHPDAGKLRAKL